VAETDGPQDITVHGKSVAVVVARSTFDRLSAAQDLAVSYLLDTNVCPGSGVESRMATSLRGRVPTGNDLYLSVLSLGAIRRGTGWVRESCRLAAPSHWLGAELRGPSLVGFST